MAREADTLNTYLPDADFNDRTGFGTTGGTGNTNVSAIVGDRLASLTGDTFAPTALLAAADCVTALIALQEVDAPPAFNCTLTLDSGFVGVQIGPAARWFETEEIREALKQMWFRVKSESFPREVLLCAVIRRLKADGIDPKTAAFNQLKASIERAPLEI